MPEYANVSGRSPILSYNIRKVKRMDGKVVKRIVVQYGRPVPKTDTTEAHIPPRNKYTYTEESTSKVFMQELEVHLGNGIYAARHILGLTGRGEVRRRGGHAYRRKTRR